MNHRHVPNILSADLNGMTIHIGGDGAEQRQCQDGVSEISVAVCRSVMGCPSAKARCAFGHIHTCKCQLLLELHSSALVAPNAVGQSAGGSLPITSPKRFEPATIVFE